jgi:hypothetical protein
MDLIFNKHNNTAFTNDKTLWLSALQKKPGFEELLGFQLVDPQHPEDTPGQHNLRLMYPNRDEYLDFKVAGGMQRAVAINEWNALWANHAAPPPNARPAGYNHYALALPAANMNAVDYWGFPVVGNNAGNGILARPLTMPPFQPQRQWLQANPGYQVMGWQGNPNNPVIGPLPPGGGWALPAAGIY